MPHKSRHGRGKHPHSRKRSKIRQMQAVAGSPPQTTNGIAQPSVPAGVAPTPKSPMPKAAALPAAAMPAHYEYVNSDLKRIAILTGIIFVILIVLYFILS